MNFIQKGYLGKNDWWMYIVTLLIVFVATQLGSLPLILTALLKVNGDIQKFREGALDNFMNIGMDLNLYLFLMILSFAFGLLALWVCVKFIHQKKWSWVITARENIDWKRVFYGAVVWGILVVATIAIGIVLVPENYIWNFKPIPFFILLVVSFLFIPLQTSLEEVMFRGYYMQAIGQLAKNRWVPLIVTSLLFGLLHGANPEIAELGKVALLFYIGTGLFFGIVSLLDEGSELAIGMHAINNIVAALFVTTDWTVFRTEALYIDTSEPEIGWDFFILLILYPLIIFVFSKKYGWTHWKEKLFGKVTKPELIED